MCDDSSDGNPWVGCSRCAEQRKVQLLAKFSFRLINSYFVILLFIIITSKIRFMDNLRYAVLGESAARPATARSINLLGIEFPDCCWH